ncbi:MAG: hypothetical protein K6E79_00200 [Pseudobutyrivibrio sp.]|nr:hypothetical protein [Pseudobutyrivibrio sp.]
MKQNLKKALTKDIGLKILAIAFAFFLWLVVVNIDDPTQTRTFTAVVTVTNADTLSKSGKLYEIKDGINTVSFRVTAKRSIIEKLSPSDFSAVADMNYLESEERVPVTISAKSYASSITISSKQNYLYVILEDEATNKFVINAEYTGTPESGLEVDTVECSPTVVTVKGPQDQVSAISSVKAICDITGATTDFTENVIPVLYDANGEALDTSDLSISVSTVSVSVNFVSVKSADIVVKTSGTLASDLTLGSISTDPASVMIKGEDSALNDVSTITIPESVINLSNITGSFVTTVDISSYLPEGVTLADKNASKVTITVTMSGDTKSTITIPSGNIEFNNLDEGLAATLDATDVTVNIFGTEEELAAITADDIKGYIDCSGLAVGEKQNVAAQFTNVNGVTVQNTSVTITITEDASAAGTTNETDTSAESKEE